MYSIAFYENGRFCTNLGGPVGTLTEALSQMRSLLSDIEHEELRDYLGYKYNRSGTPCALLVFDEFGSLIKNV